jgi:hypothetical protein
VKGVVTVVNKSDPFEVRSFQGLYKNASISENIPKILCFQPDSPGGRAL